MTFEQWWEAIGKLHPDSDTPKQMAETGWKSGQAALGVIE